MGFSDEFKSSFDALKDSVNGANGHYQVWFTLRGKGKALDKHYPDMNESAYVDFFKAINIANYKMMFVEIGCIFDTDKKSHRFRDFKNLLDQQGHTDLVEMAEEKIGPYRELVSNLLTILSKLIAHKEKAISPQELYRKHGINPYDIGCLLNDLAFFMREVEQMINGGASWSSIGPTDRWEQATWSMLKVLSKGRSS